MTQEPQKDSLATRRGMLAGVGLVGLAGAITACSSGSSSSAAAAGTATTSAPAAASSASSSSAASGSAASGSASASASSGSAAGALTSASKIPVGGGMIFDAEKIVVTQPKSGEYKAFSAVCTHMGCLVGTISGGDIICPCHGSHYSIATGDVVSGPAPKPLPAEKIKVTGGNIFLE